MKKWMRAALAAWLVMLAFSSVAQAETCTKSTTTTVRWAAASDALWSGCTADATDDFVVAAGRVETSGSFTVNSLTVTGGQFVQSPGTVLTLSVHGRVQGGVFAPTGEVRYKGRVRAVTINGGATPTTVVTLPATMTNTATTSDFLVVLDDDPADLDASIRQPIQTTQADPEPGKYRPSPEKWRWYPITAVSGQTVTISTNAFSNVEAGLPVGGTSAYSGTRGPGLATAATVTNNGPLGQSLYSELAIDIETAGGATVTEDGDLSDQVLEITSGNCATKRLQIEWVDAAAATTADKVYVKGDTGRCGSTFSGRIHMGLGIGDPVAIVRPATIRGGDAAHFEWSGGAIKAKWARWVRLDDQGASQAGTEDWGGNCTFCIFRTSTTTPEFSKSYLEDVELGYLNTSTADTGALSVVNFNNGQTAYLTTRGALDATGFRVRRLYVHDEANQAASAGIHGAWLQGVRNLDIAQMRVERNGDDGFFANPTDFGNGNAATVTLRHFIARALLSPGSTSQQCVNVAPTDTGSSGITAELWTQSGAFNLADASMFSCDDNPANINTIGTVVRRAATGGSAGKGGTAAPGFSIGSITSFTNQPPANAIETRPNRLISSLVSFIGPTSVSANALILGGTCEDSIIYGGELMTAINPHAINPAAFYRCFLNGGVSSAGTTLLTRQSTSQTALVASTIEIEDSVLMRAVNTVQLCSNMDTAATAGDSDFEVRRSQVSGNTPPANGILTTCFSASTGDAQKFSADGLMVTMVTPGAGGLGAATSGKGTLEGRRVRNALVEATSAPTAATAFGTYATETSQHAYSLGPDVNTNAPIYAFVGDDGMRPAKLGLAEYGTEQALAGDLFNEQFYNWANADLAEVLAGAE